MTEIACPTDSLLWSVVMDDTVSPELRGHVDACSSCQRSVHTLEEAVLAVRSVPRGSDPESRPWCPSEPLPECIGEYTILARIGSGGQADVYRAWHPRLKTDVVIKWFRREAFLGMDPSQLTSEARILSTLRHPFLGRVFDVGVEQDRCFIIMEYIQGVTFSEWIRRYKPTFARIAAVLANAARAIDAVHKHGALHLDLKPGNIMVCHDGTPRIIDFGMAQLRFDPHRFPPMLTAGTPEYMSPEQCAGDSLRISQSTDVYGLGAVLFSALAQQPIRGPGRMRLEPDWSLIRHAPWRLRSICRRALATRPGQRFDSATSLARALDRFAANASIIRIVAAIAVMSVAAFGMVFAVSAKYIRHEAMTSNGDLSDTRVAKPDEHVDTTSQTDIPQHQWNPQLIIATNSTQPFTFKLPLEIATQLRANTRIDDVHFIRFEDGVGPRLVLTCDEQAWKAVPDLCLSERLELLESLPLKSPLRIAIDNERVEIVPLVAESTSTDDFAHRQTAISVVQEMQAVIQDALPVFHGVIVIPASSDLLASVSGGSESREP